MEGGGFAASGWADHGDDAVTAAGGMADERLLLHAQWDRCFEDRAFDVGFLSRWGSRSDSFEGDREGGVFVLEELEGGVAAGLARSRLVWLELAGLLVLEQLVGEGEDLSCGCPFSLRVCDCLDELGSREGGLLLGQTCWAEQPLREYVLVDAGAACPGWGGGDCELVEGRGGEPVACRAVMPLPFELCRIDRRLRLAGGERAHPGGVEAVEAPLAHVLDKGFPSRGELSDHCPRDGGELCHAFLGLGPGEAEPVGELVSELSLVEVAGREPVRLQDRPAVERQPLPVSGPGHVGDNNVGVQVRVLRSARAVAERGRDKPNTGLALGTALAAPHEARLVLQVGERRTPRLFVGVADRPPHPLVLAQRVQHTDALRTREHQIEARHRRQPLALPHWLARNRIDGLHGDRAPTRRSAQHVPARRVDPTQHHSELAIPCDALETETSGGAAGPEAGRLAAAREVVVHTPGDLRLVVALHPHRQLPNAQHQEHPAPRPPTPGPGHHPPPRDPTRAHHPTQPATTHHPTRHPPTSKTHMHPGARGARAAATRDARTLRWVVG